MRSLLGKLFRFLAFRYNLFPGMYRRLCNPLPDEYAEYLRLHGGFYAMGQKCSILTTTVFTDPAYVRLGNNVQFGSCCVLGHNGVVKMLNRAFGVKLDSVGKSDFRDNVFIGYGCIILPGVTIGPNAIVGAGSVVTRDVPPNSVVVGAPARRIASVDDFIKKLETKTAEYPWADLIYSRQGAIDHALEPELRRQRIAYFYGEGQLSASTVEETPIKTEETEQPVGR
jgi:acetyltransferase-like isoleucine patch superfamily enzyme